MIAAVIAQLLVAFICIPEVGARDDCPIYSSLVTSLFLPLLQEPWQGQGDIFGSSWFSAEVTLS